MHRLIEWIVFTLRAFAASAVQSPNIVARGEDFPGARTVPVRSGHADTATAGNQGVLVGDDPLRPATGRAPLRLQRSRAMSLRLTHSVPGRLGVAFVGLGLAIGAAMAEETWPAVLNRMPLGTGATELSRTNCAQLILGGFESNATVKALIFMPGATDELYFFHRVQATLTNAEPSLYDAVVALTNQSPLRVVFRAPFLLIHSEEDVLDLDIKVKHERTAAKLKTGKPLPQVVVIDRDWTQLRQLIKHRIGPTLLPYEGMTSSWHFYRHTFAGWNLTPWETLEACALAGKTKFTVIRNGVVFELDSRTGALPKLEHFPGR